MDKIFTLEIRSGSNTIHQENMSVPMEAAFILKGIAAEAVKS
jgi:hypothetical protein